MQAGICYFKVSGHRRVTSSSVLFAHRIRRWLPHPSSAMPRHCSGRISRGSWELPGQSRFGTNWLRGVSRTSGSTIRAVSSLRISKRITQETCACGPVVMPASVVSALRSEGRSAVSIRDEPLTLFNKCVAVVGDDGRVVVEQTSRDRGRAHDRKTDSHCFEHLVLYPSRMVQWRDRDGGRLVVRQHVGDVWIDLHRRRPLAKAIGIIANDPEDQARLTLAKRRPTST